MSRAVPLSLLLIASCSLFPPNGLTGNGSFQYECVGSGADPECDDREVFSVGAELPTHPIARGAHFRLTYLSKDNPVKPASTTAVSSTGGSFVVKRAGTVGFFVDADEAGQIEDAVRLRVAEPDRVVMSRKPAAGFGETSVPAGTSVIFRATSTAKGEMLVGALPVSWSLEDDSGVAELEPKPFGTCTLRGLKPGKVKLRARFGDLQDQVEIVIARAIDDFDAGSDSSPDSSADSSTDGNAEAGDASLD